MKNVTKLVVMKRKKFIERTTLGFSSVLISPYVFSEKSEFTNKKKTAFTPFALATWNVQHAVTIAGKALDKGTSSLNAAIKGVAVEEANTLNTTVGNGGAPDREGNVTLDVEKRAFSIDMVSAAYVINNPAYDGWKFLERKKELSPLLEKMLPKKVLKKLK